MKKTTDSDSYSSVRDDCCSLTASLAISFLQMGVFILKQGELL